MLVGSEYLATRIAAIATSSAYALDSHDDNNDHIYHTLVEHRAIFWWFKHLKLYFNEAQENATLLSIINFFNFYPPKCMVSVYLCHSRYKENEIIMKFKLAPNGTYEHRSKVS